MNEKKVYLPYILYLTVLSLVFIIWVYLHVSPQKNIVEAEPIQNSVMSPLNLTSRAFIAIYVDESGKEIILTEKNSEEEYPIASLSKLTTAIVSTDETNLAKEITVTKSNLLFPEGRYKLGDKLFHDSLLHSLLIESDNNAAGIVASERRNFVNHMNTKARSIGLSHTQFVNPSGLDNYLNNTYVGTSTKKSQFNYSSAHDIAKTMILINTKYPYLKKILGKSDVSIFDARGKLHHVVKTTNDLLKDPVFSQKVIFGKTGETPLAKKNLALVAVSPNKNGYIVLVILGSQDHFEDMKTLLTWVELAYSWN